MSDLLFVAVDCFLYVFDLFAARQIAEVLRLLDKGGDVAHQGDEHIFDHFSDLLQTLAIKDLFVVTYLAGFANVEPFEGVEDLC